MVMPQPQRRYRIRFINPNAALTTITMPELIRTMTFSRRAIFAPTGLTICASVMPPHWDVEVVDECTRSEPHVPTADVDIVGITAMTTQANRAYELADRYRALGVSVIMGGIHPSALPEDALKHCDAVCKGDAESTLPHLIADWEADAQALPRIPRTNGDRPADPARADRRLKPIYDWSTYPSAPIGRPRKDLLNPTDYLIFNPIQTTRGCPHTCNFCTTPGVFGRKFRQRDIADIVDEIREARERFGSWCFIFADDDFGGNHRWALEMCAALEPLKISWASQCDILISKNDQLLAAMRRSGCVGLILGLESRKQDTLSEAGKRFVKADSYEWRIRKIQSYGISLWGAFIFGFDHDRWQDLMETCRFAQRMDLCMSCYPILTPYPGTGVWNDYVREGRITDQNWDRYNGASVVYAPKQFTPKQLRHAQMAAFAEFYTPRSALRRLKLYPLKGRAWVANLAIWKGIRWYYAKRGRRIPRFADFLDPRSPGWDYKDGESFAEACLPCQTPTPNLAQLALQHSDPFHQAGEFLHAVAQRRAPGTARTGKSVAAVG
ncbi:MAG: B12-binding domain-containing radical SAM protein [Phycisphaerae bacterium]|nr:B12-binding domain-containing radical SAM protein [Phycisphaerae bacterium]